MLTNIVTRCGFKLPLKRMSLSVRNLSNLIGARSSIPYVDTIARGASGESRDALCNVTIYRSCRNDGIRCIPTRPNVVNTCVDNCLNIHLCFETYICVCKHCAHVHGLNAPCAPVAMCPWAHGPMGHEPNGPMTPWAHLPWTTGPCAHEFIGPAMGPWAHVAAS